MPEDTTQETNGAATRREELLRIAGELFATKGFRRTTVRVRGVAAGILSAQGDR